MKCQICGKEDETMKIPVPAAWRKIDPKLPLGHAEMCFECGCCEEYGTLPKVLQASPKKPGYINNVKKSVSVAKTTKVVSNKEGGHKMAKDEVKTELDSNTLKTIIQTVASSATNLALRVKNLETVRDKAEALADVKILSDALEVLTDSWKVEIRQLPGFYEMFPNLDKKVLLQEGKALTEIDNKVLDVLTLAEIKKIVRVTEKGLKDIGHEDFVAKYKVTTGKGDPSVQVRDLSQDDLKKLAEGKK